MAEEKYCAYCRGYRPAKGFKLIPHNASGTQRSMCTGCQDIRKKPRPVLQQLADQEREARKGKPK